MIHQISQAPTLTKVIGMHLSAVANTDGVDVHDSLSVDDNTAVCEVPADRDVVGAQSGHAVMDDSKVHRRTDHEGPEGE